MNVTTAPVAFSVLMLAIFAQALAGESTTEPSAKPPYMLTIQVQTVDGKAMPDVSVVCIGQETNAVLKDTIIEGGGQRLRTDGQGRFTLKWNGQNIGLMIATDKGFCLAQSRDLTNHPVLVVQPWGRIRGVRTDHGHPLPNHRVSLQIIGRCVDPQVSNRIDLDDESSTDSQGSFIFEHVPAVEMWLQDVQVWQGANTRNKTTSARLREIDMQSGETKRVEISTHGRTVVGQIELGPGLSDTIDLKSLDESFFRGLGPEGLDSRKRPWVPAEFDNADQRAKWYLDWLDNTEAGRQRKLDLAKYRAVMIHADGSFISEMVEPGSYVFSGRLVQNHRTAALLELHFVVPPAGVGNDDVPCDVGKTTLTRVINLKAGDLAPDFSVPTLDGQPIKLSDFRGKYVLLDFWATWCGPCVAQTSNLKATYDAFGKDERFEMISLSCDSDREAPAKFVKAKSLAWTQVFLGGEWSKGITGQNYGVTAIPQTMLIGPDGRIIARDLRGPKIAAAVASALKKR